MGNAFTAATLKGRHGETLTLVPGDFDDPLNFGIHVSAGGFSADMVGVFLIKRGSLEDELDALLAGRLARIEIEGSEGLHIELVRRGVTFEVYVRVCRVVYLNDARKSFDQMLTCAFEVDGEALVQFADAVRPALA